MNKPLQDMVHQLTLDKADVARNMPSTTLVVLLDDARAIAEQVYALGREDGKGEMAARVFLKVPEKQTLTPELIRRGKELYEAARTPQDKGV